MIRSFRNKTTEDIFNGEDTRLARHVDRRVWRRAQELLEALDDAITIRDMAAPPSNHLHPLHRDRKGQHAIWINAQYRLCFRWTAAGPEDVEIIDYHP